MPEKKTFLHWRRAKFCPVSPATGIAGSPCVVPRQSRPTAVCLCLVSAIILLLAAAAVYGQAERTTLVWLSIDGFRHDYTDRADTPVLDRLKRQGVFTRGLVPVFPSLTFPTHVSKVTGVGADRHGITSNIFYDSRRERTYRYPPWSGMVEAEMIWNTATRQGLRVAVFDWPLSGAQRGQYAAEYFQDRFDSSLSDRRRLELLLDTWEKDQHRLDRAPLRLLGSWIGDLDRAGHEYGPEAPEIADVVSRTDDLLGEFMSRALDIWSLRAGDGDSLVLALTTDHGMSRVHSLVNLSLLLDWDGRDEGAALVTSGNLANVHLDGLDREKRAGLEERLLAEVADLAFIQAYRRAELPERWRYAHPRRSGDLVFVLSPGYTFSRRPDVPVAPVEDFGGPLGMHGYDPATDPDMKGFSVIWRWPEPWGGIELEKVEMLRLYPTMSGLLGIEPSPEAVKKPISLP